MSESSTPLALAASADRQWEKKSIAPLPKTLQGVDALLVQLEAHHANLETDLAALAAAGKPGTSVRSRLGKLAPNLRQLRAHRTKLWKKAQLQAAQAAQQLTPSSPNPSSHVTVWGLNGRKHPQLNTQYDDLSPLSSPPTSRPQSPVIQEPPRPPSPNSEESNLVVEEPQRPPESINIEPPHLPPPVIEPPRSPPPNGEELPQQPNAAVEEPLPLNHEPPRPRSSNSKEPPQQPIAIAQGPQRRSSPDVEPPRSPSPNIEERPQQPNSTIQEPLPPNNECPPSRNSKEPPQQPIAIAQEPQRRSSPDVEPPRSPSPNIEERPQQPNSTIQEPQQTAHPSSAPQPPVTLPNAQAPRPRMGSRKAQSFEDIESSVKKESVVDFTTWFLKTHIAFHPDAKKTFEAAVESGNIHLMDIDNDDSDNDNDNDAQGEDDDEHLDSNDEDAGPGDDNADPDEDNNGNVPQKRRNRKGGPPRKRSRTVPEDGEEIRTLGMRGSKRAADAPGKPHAAVKWELTPEEKKAALIAKGKRQWHRLLTLREPLTDEVRTWTRRSQEFLPAAATYSYTSAASCFINGNGRTICHYHQNCDHNSKKNDLSITPKLHDPLQPRLTGVPYRPTAAPSKHTKHLKRPAGTPRGAINPAFTIERIWEFFLVDDDGDPYMHCGCYLEDALIDFYFWKTTRLWSSDKSYSEGLNLPLQPRYRAYLVNILSTYGMDTTTLYNYDTEFNYIGKIQKYKSRIELLQKQIEQWEDEARELAAADG